jgi:hypothetical protein
MKAYVTVCCIVSCPTLGRLAAFVANGFVLLASDRSLPVISPCPEVEETNSAKELHACNGPPDWSSLQAE